MLAADWLWLEVAARFYDLDLRGHDEDIAFWVNLARHFEGSVLEIGCGTGRVTAALASEGLDVTGIEISPAMLAAARRRLGGAIGTTVTLVETDMRSLDLNRRFELIAVPLAGFCHLLTAADQLAALAAMRRHLGPAGLLALDLPQLEPDQWQPGSVPPLRREWRRKDNDGRWLQKWSSATPDFARQTQRITYEYRFEDGTAPVAFSFVLRYVFPAEAGHLLARAGFAVEAVYGSYDLAPFDAGASRMLIIARAENRP